MPALYIRTVTIERPKSTLSAAGGLADAQPSQSGGSSPYIGLTRSSDSRTTIATGVPCSIQARNGGATKGTLPSDAPGPMRWKVFIPRSAIEPRTLRDRDELVDDEDQRYQVLSNYWNLLGYTLETIRLEA